MLSSEFGRHIVPDLDALRTTAIAPQINPSITGVPVTPVDPIP